MPSTFSASSIFIPVQSCIKYFNKERVLESVKEIKIAEEDIAIDLEYSV